MTLRMGIGSKAGVGPSLQTEYVSTPWYLGIEYLPKAECIHNKRYTLHGGIQLHFP